MNPVYALYHPLSARPVRYTGAAWMTAVERG
jgi:hypothetical protein